MEVRLISGGDAGAVIATASRICYMKDAADPMDYFFGSSPQDVAKQLNILEEAHHESPIEHASFTFYIDGVSRVLLAQLTRHRLASYSVQSQRYVKFTDDHLGDLYVIPPNVESSEKASLVYNDAILHAIAKYNELADILEEEAYNRLLENVPKDLITNEAYYKKLRSKAEKIAIEDARYVLPSAMCTRLVMTMNARSLKNFFELRCCNRAQWEIRELAIEMYKLCLKSAHTLFRKMGPPCCGLDGKCNQGNMCCGHMKDVQEEFDKIRTI